MSEGERYSLTRTGVVEGNPVSDILLDTGCSRTLIHSSLVPEQNILEGKVVTIFVVPTVTLLYSLGGGTNTSQWKTNPSGSSSGRSFASWSIVGHGHSRVRGTTHGQKGRRYSSNGNYPHAEQPTSSNNKKRR